VNIQRGLLFSLLPIVLLTACDGDGNATSNGGSGGSSTGGGGAGGGTGGETTTGGGGSGGSTGGSSTGGSSTGGSSAGGGGAGGSSTGGAGGAGMGACTNDADTALISDPSKDIPGAVGDCAQMNFGMEPATLNCIKMTGLSDACAQCFDDTVQCIFMNCLNQCIAGADSQPCVDCRAQFCDPAFAECSGLTP
jgi:hypothetical protein